MKEKYVVLRSLYGDGQVYFGTSKTDAERTGLAADLEELDTDDVEAVASEPGTQGVALAMPMRLIKSVEENGAGQPAAGGVTWGVKAVRADTTPFDGTGITVAVLDTGITKGHEAFAGMEVIKKDFTGQGEDDTHGHGTHCAGTIFGRDVQGTRIGVARGVKKALIAKVVADNEYETLEVVKAILWAVQEGANVISMSIGIDFPLWVEQQQAKGVSTQLAASRAQAGYTSNIQLFERITTLLETEPYFQPVVLVAAAGNESNRVKEPVEVINVCPPAAAKDVVSVASLADGAHGYTVSATSNGGAKVSGPGVSVISAAIGGGLCTKSGTSMATPHVAGVAALWAQKLQASGRLTSSLLRSCVIASGGTARLRAGWSPRDVGAGLVDAPQH